MAGRGRGRGRNMSFTVESLGFGRGEALPAPTLQPPSSFPPLEYKPVSLLGGDDYNYLLTLKQELRGAMQESPYYLKFQEKKKNIIRYSDKYQANGQNGDVCWEPDWSMMPAELKPKKKRTTKSGVKPNVSAAKKDNKTLDPTLLNNLQDLEKKEQQGEGDEEEDEEAKGSGDEALDEEYYDEEEMEEETDYISSYFDNGEGYGMDDEEDGLDDGPVY